MRNVLLLVGLCALPVLSQPEERIFSVIWNVQERKLRIEVAIGKTVDGKYILERLDEQYTVDPDRATVTYGGETRGFDGENPEGEARGLRHLLDTLAKYSAGTVSWWKDGRGTPIKKKQPMRAGRNGRNRPLP